MRTHRRPFEREYGTATRAMGAIFSKLFGTSPPRTVRVVCVSPVASARAAFTLDALRAAYAGCSADPPVTVVFDDRDADRKVYAPAFRCESTTEASADCAWEEGTYDGVLMMAAISDAQGRALTTLLNSDRCSSFVANGAPGFNVGCSAASIGLTRTMRRAGLVEDSSEAHTTPCTLEGRIPGYTTPLYAD